MTKKTMNEMLENHNIIVNKDVAITHADKMLPIARQFIHDLTSVMSPSDYESSPNEFIEMVIALQTYISASLLITITDMYPDVSLSMLLKNHTKSLDASLAVQLRDHNEIMRDMV